MDQADLGFIKLWRKMKYSPVFFHPDHEMFRVWVFLLLTATFKESEEDGAFILRGQLFTSREDLRAKLFPTGGNMLTERCCWKMVTALADMGNINIDGSEEMAVVTINKWAIYQDKDAHSDRGYFRLYRKIRDSDVFMVPELLKLWVYCLASASFEDTHVPPDLRAMRTQPLRRGQFTVGRNKLRQDLFGKIYRGTPTAVTCWRWLHKLADMGAITIQSQGSHSVVTINNWSAYQG